jgi:transposase
VKEVELRTQEQEVWVHVDIPGDVGLKCPECTRVCARYDRAEERRWRHLDTCQYQTILVSRIPRIQCSEHGVRRVSVPWAEERSRFTALFEAWAIRVLRECSLMAAAELLRVSWDAIEGIQRRAVERGLARRTTEVVPVIGIDETSFQKRHEYVTVMVDLQQDRVLWVGDDRKEATLRQGFDHLTPAQLSGVEAIVMDMWDPYIAATRKAMPNWKTKLVFDRYHVMWHVTRAVDVVRRLEQKDAKVRHLLKRTRYLWLRGKGTRLRKHNIAIAQLCKAGLKVGRAWAMKESLTGLWDYKTVRGAERFFKRWWAWVARSRLPEMKKAAQTIKHYFDGIVAYIQHPYTNARTEAINAKIQEIKYRARGYRNRNNYRMAILFHCGKLSMDPL